MLKALKPYKNFAFRLVNAAIVAALLIWFAGWAHTAAAADAETQAQIDAAVRAASRGPFAQDGTFAGSAQGFGGPIEVSVTVADGYLDAIDIVSADQEDEAWLTEALATIPAMLSAQTTNVDVVSGATFSSAGIINATKDALSSANTQE